MFLRMFLFDFAHTKSCNIKPIPLMFQYTKALILSWASWNLKSVMLLAWIWSFSNKICRFRNDFTLSFRNHSSRCSSFCSVIARPSDFVTNSYGQSWDSSCEKSWVPVKHDSTINESVNNSKTSSPGNHKFPLFVGLPKKLKIESFLGELWFWQLFW